MTPILDPPFSIPFQARLVRRAARRMLQELRYGRQSLAHAPVLFANSFPKSGTHLLTQVLQGFTRIGPAVDSGLPAIVTFQGDTGRQRAEAETLSDFARLLPGDIAYGHVHALPRAVTFLCREDVATFFILRDPRDVAVSHVHYVTEMAPGHIHHRYYQEELKDFNERLSASITGVNEISLPDIRARFGPYMGWLDHPEVLTLRYEAFVADRHGTVERVFGHAVGRGFAPSCPREAAIQSLLQSIDPQRSPTFRSGKTGGWRTAFTDEHKALFKEVTGDLLIHLGYEEHHEW